MKKLLMSLVVLLAAAAVFAGGGQDTAGGVEKTDILFLTNAYSHYKEELPKYLAEFESANPDVHVLVESYPYSKLLELIELKLSAKTEEPDVLFVDVPLTSAYTAKRYPPELVRYLTTNGKEKVMFGTNYPMLTPAKALSDLPALELSPDTEELFLGGNAQRVFGIDR